MSSPAHMSPCCGYTAFASARSCTHAHAHHQATTLTPDLTATSRRTPFDHSPRTHFRLLLPPLVLQLTLRYEYNPRPWPP
jgi:hypothetical protein